MPNHIVCPNCKINISDHPMIDAAEKGVGLGTQSFNCENCGERITYWAITAQLREQKTVVWRFKNWARSLSQGRS